MPFAPPYPPWDPTDKKSFSYETVLKRWPIIITSVIDVLHRKCHEISLEIKLLEKSDNEDGSKIEDLRSKVTRGTQVIEKVSKLKYEMARDRALGTIPEDGEFGAAEYNTALEMLQKENRNTWFTAPWLYAECYLYRLIRSFFLQSGSWISFDPFFDQKIDTFKQSGRSVFQIATTMHEISAASEGTNDTETLKVLFKEMIQMCLWGNATDLSLLTHLSQNDIQRLQSVGKEAQATRSKYILRDDQEAVWNHLQTLKDARVDFVLDNSGFELFTDLIFADFLVKFTPYVSRVVFHPKLIPWFVSDVTPPDFTQTFALLSDPSLFPDEAKTPTSAKHLHDLVARWTKHFETGAFSLSVPLDTPLGGGGTKQSQSAEFWTMSNPYWDMEVEAPETFAFLKESALVIFKGDLNYRKLTGDIRWPAWTPFDVAIGPLAQSFPILSLRTNKADVVVGVEKEVAEHLDQSDPKWRVDGRYALVSFVPVSK